VEFIPRARLEARDVLGYGAELVVIATGSSWAGDGLNAFTRAPIPGADASLPWVLTPEQLMVEGKEPRGERVVVYDCDGYFMGVSLAERLAREGRHVTIVTPLSSVVPYTGFTGELFGIREALRELGVEVRPGHSIVAVDEERVRLATDGTEAELAADSVVLITQRVSVDTLYRELRLAGDGPRAAGITGVFRVGDCVVPRLIADAIFDGHRLAREIDSDDPAQPLPYIRENRVVGSTDDDYVATLRQTCSAPGSAAG
jgi:dimethylamine/trimethylamine dehydrogenase